MTMRSRWISMLAVCVSTALIMFGVTAPTVAQGPKPDASKPDAARLDAAKKEGKIVWYTSLVLPSAEKVAKLFEAAYPGIKVEVHRTGSQRILQRVLQELQAGIKLVDVVHTSDAGHFILLKEKKLLAKYTPPGVDAFPPGLNTRQPIAAGITTVDKAYTPRALHAMAHLWHAASRWPDEDMREKLLFTLTSLYQRVTLFSEFRFWGGSGNTANYNVPYIINEQNVFRTFLRKAKTISWYFKTAPRIPREVEVRTQSACHLTHVPDKSVDYIFTDPTWLIRDARVIARGPSDHWPLLAAIERSG